MFKKKEAVIHHQAVFLTAMDRIPETVMIVDLHLAILDVKVVELSLIFNRMIQLLISLNIFSPS